jgi:uncharacterized membrane protein HdeD (DUF308 family)
VIVLLIGDWRKLAVRGLAAMMFGLLTLLWPSITLTALVLLFGAFVLLNGAAILAVALRGEPEIRGDRGWLIFEGVVSVGAGLLTFAWPHITALVLLYLIAFWAAVTGALELAIGVRLRRALRHEWLFYLAGVVSLLFAAWLIISPGAGALAITWLIGSYAVVSGAIVLALANKLRKLESSLQPRSRPMRQVTA